MEHNSQFETTRSTPGLSCPEFDALLGDALDGTLTAASQWRFEAHREQCATCASLFRETAAGMTWLNSLEEVEPPASLIHNILAATSEHRSAALAAVPKLGWKQRLSGMLADLAIPVRLAIRQPRMAMTAAMAVFSISLTLNLAGVRLSDLRHVDLRPSAIKQQATMKYYETSSRVVKYYENIRLVYEVESRLQELKRATSTDEQVPPPRQPDRNKTENKRNDQERKQNYYSMEHVHVQLAAWSRTQLQQSGNLTQNVAAQDDAANNIFNSSNDFAIAELSRGLERRAKPSDAGNGDRWDFRDKSIRSFLA